MAKTIHCYECKTQNRWKTTYNSVFEKTIEKITKYRDISLLKTNKRSYLAVEANYYTTKLFTEKGLAIKMNEITVKMNKPIYLGILILEISKTAVYEFWYDSVETKYQDKANYMDRNSFIAKMKLKMFIKALSMMLKK